MGVHVLTQQPAFRGETPNTSTMSKSTLSNPKSTCVRQRFVVGVGFYGTSGIILKYLIKQYYFNKFYI